MYNSMIQSKLSFLPVAPVDGATAAAVVSPAAGAPAVAAAVAAANANPTPAVVPVTPAAAAVTPVAATVPITAVAPPAQTAVQTSSSGVSVSVPSISPADATAKYGDPMAGSVVDCIQKSYMASSTSATGPKTGTGPASCIIKASGSLGPCSQQGLMGPPQCNSCGVNVAGCTKMAALYAKMYAGGDLSGTYTY
jgi:hypothetical protein